MLLLTHVDLDGIGSKVVYRCFEECDGEPSQVKVFNYDELGALIPFIESNCEVEDDVFIVDLNYKNIDEIIELKKKYPNLVYIDHHNYDDKYYKVSFDWLVIPRGNDKSGALLFADYINESKKFSFKSSVKIDRLTQFVKYVSSYDTWQWAYQADKTPKKLNDIYFIKDKEMFTNEILQYIYGKTDSLIQDKDEYLLEIDRQKKDHRYKKLSNNCEVHRDSDGNRYIWLQMLTADSEMMNRLLEDDRYNINYIAAYSYSSKAVQFRSTGDFDVSVIAKKYGGGGHTNAAGCLIPEQFLNNFRL